MASDSPVMGGGGAWRRVGLTNAEFRMGSRSRLRMTRRPGADALCVAVEEVTVSLSFPRLVIYVPREYRRESCAYREIVDHEYDHVAAHRRTLERFEDRFRQAAGKAMADLSPFRADSQPEAEQRVNAALDRALRPVLDAFRHEQRTANRALDTEEAYRAIQRRCQDW